MREPRESELLSRIEELILLVVGELGQEAYGVPIRRRLGRVLGRKLSVGAVYVPLERMLGQGLLAAETGNPTPVRGGRRKRFYHLTAKGRRALHQTKRVTQSAWAAMDKARLEGETA
jgi:PadR family transcriptional regulator, regulatory protein PadR